MVEITYEQLKRFLIETEFDCAPSQKEISFPVIQRIHRRLQQRNSFNAIKVNKNRIIDGHHRYISHKLLSLDIESKISGSNSTYIEYVWAEINLTTIDYDTEEAKIIFQERYDKQ